MHKQTIEYTANYGRFRNLSANWIYQQSSQQPLQQYKFRKKQYPQRKSQIQKYKMLNTGDIYLPKVSDLILDVSDIQGTHTDTIKSEAVRNRLIAKEMRQRRERQSRIQSENEKIRGKQRLIRATVSLPKQSYHYMHKQNNPQTVKTEGDDREYIHSIRTTTLPEEPADLHQKYCNVPLKNVNHTTSIGVSRDNTPKSMQNLSYHNCDNFMTDKKRSLIETGKNVLDYQSFRDIKDVKSTIQERLKIMNEKRLPKAEDSVHNLKTISVLPQGYENRRARIEGEVSHNRLSRINPTFLSFGSEYLNDKNNYLAHYRNRSVLG